MKHKQNKYLLPIIILILFTFFIFRRRIIINSLFFIYDIYSLFGFYWRFSPEYCSPMKNGFKPAMPLEYYSEFNQNIFPRIYTGNNNINKDKIISICDRNLKWLQTYGKICEIPSNIEILHVSDPKFKQKVLYYVKNDYPFVMRGVNLKCFTTMRFNNLIKIAGDKKVYMSPSSEDSCPNNIFTELKNINENKCYITNSTNLFYYYDYLLPDSDIDIIKNIIDHYMYNNSKQLFVGITKGTGTALHAAYTNNFFLMIQGEEKMDFF